MADTAARLVDHVLPEVPIRQWVLTLPYPLRYRCAWNARLTSEVLQSFLRAVFADQRRIRENMRRVNNRSQLYQRYVKKLDRQENALEALENKLESAGDARRKAEKALADYLAALDI